ncbi:D-lyxose isomerase [Clostridia bacterium]|nr:D-lyxose isomerase [Clostridia bacterium]
MITKQEYENAKKATVKAFRGAGIKMTEAEEERIEVADFGLGDLKNIGLEILTYVNTERVCAKELYLLPYQTCPEHIHADGPGYSGKEETFRCRRGKVYLYVSGEPVKKVGARIPDTVLTVFHEIELNEGEQYTLYPNTKHWFQGGAEGAIVSEFSTRSRDESDIFTDPKIRRIPETE